MFYETDLLNRRGGKFAIIWLAAHEQLKLQGQGSRNDLRMALAVNIDYTLKDILQYVQGQKLPEAPNQGSPRFSLYLSAMLTHGAVLIHNLQVKHEVAHLKLKFDLQAAGRKKKRVPNRSSVNCLDDSANLEIANESELFGQRNFRAPEAMFGTMNVSVEKAIAIELNGSIEGVREAGQAAAPLFNDDYQEKGTPERIRDDFEAVESESEGTFTTLRKGGPLSVSPSRITMKEIEPLEPADLHLFEEEGFGVNLNFDMNPDDNLFAELPAAVPMEEDPNFVEPGPGTPGRPNLIRSNSKRGRDNSSEYSGTPSKRRPPFEASQVQAEPIQVDNPAVVDPHQIPMVLGELGSQEPLLLHRRGKRGRKLIVDEETSISNKDFRKGMAYYADTMRAMITEEDVVSAPRYIEGKTCYLFSRPSARILSCLLRDLVTRNMIVRPVKEDIFDHIRETIPRPFDVEVQPNLTVIPDILEDRPSNLPIEEMEMLVVPALLDNAQSTDEIIESRRLKDLSSSTMPSGDFGNEPEQARQPMSKDGSYAGSILGASTSRMDVSVIDRSCASPEVAHPSECRLETLKEVSVEVSSRLAGSHEGSPLRLAERFSHIKLSPIATSRGDQRTRRTQLDQDNIPEGEELLQLIIDEMESVDSELLTFKELVPPEENDPFRAATIFENLLWLQKRKRVTLQQDAPFDNIFIGIVNEKENLLI